MSFAADTENSTCAMAASADHSSMTPFMTEKILFRKPTILASSRACLILPTSASYDGSVSSSSTVIPSMVRVSPLATPASVSRCSVVAALDSSGFCNGK